MPTTKHRRKGKVRPRGNMKTLIFPRLAFEEDPETLREDQLVQDRLRQLHGDCEWTNDEWDDATEQLVAEGKIRSYEELEQP